MNKVSFDQSSQNLVLKQIQIADMGLIHLTIGTAAVKKTSKILLFCRFFFCSGHTTRKQLDHRKTQLMYRYLRTS